MAAIVSGETASWQRMRYLHTLKGNAAIFGFRSWLACAMTSRAKRASVKVRSGRWTRPCCSSPGRSCRIACSRSLRADLTCWPNQKDLGRYAVTKDERDRMVFKVPTLRNIEKTAPYFHDGSVAKLGDAVRVMGRHQLGLELSDDEVSAIETWLKSLTGPLPTQYIKAPALPGAAG